MPTEVGVGVLVACYEFICRMVQITAESQLPTLSVCLRARGDLWVCFCLCLFLSLPQCSYLYPPEELSVNTHVIQLSHQSLPFCSSCFFVVRIHPSSTSVLLCVLLPLLAPSTDSPGAVQCPLVVLCSTFPTSPSGKLQYNGCRTYWAKMTC